RVGRDVFDARGNVALADAPGVALLHRFLRRWEWSWRTTLRSNRRAGLTRGRARLRLRRAGPGCFQAPWRVAEALIVLAPHRLARALAEHLGDVGAVDIPEALAQLGLELVLPPGDEAGEVARLVRRLLDDAVDGAGVAGHVEVAEKVERAFARIAAHEREERVHGFRAAEIDRLHDFLRRRMVGKHHPHALAGRAVEDEADVAVAARHGEQHGVAVGAFQRRLRDEEHRPGNVVILGERRAEGEHPSENDGDHPGHGPLLRCCGHPYSTARPRGGP